jgi:OmpA-OmpF porin, OOP family
MWTLAIALALSSTLLATPALARDGAFYVGGDIGGAIADDMDIDIGTVDEAVTVNHDLGFDGSIFAGYDFGAFRIEAEAAYKEASLDSYATRIRLPLEPANFPTQGDAFGSSSALSFMVNGMLDFGNEDKTSFFVGGGGGVARAAANEYRNRADATPFLDSDESEDNWKFAWQLFAGVRHALSDNTDLTLRYRYFNAGETEDVAFNGGSSGIQFRSHSLLVGVTFNFGR